jgi:membrane protease YdiL (CAAX protease family)
LTSAVYGVLTALGLGWCALRGRPWPFAHESPWIALPRAWSIGASLLAGLALAVLTIVSTRVLVRRVRFVRELHVAFRELLGPLDALSVGVLALTSGIGEEVFFRGAMQPALGLALTARIFGAVHVGPDRRFLVWTAWAALMGFALGAIHAATGSLFGCILAHVAINYENLTFIVTHDPREPAQGELGGPRLVARGERR